MFCRSPIFSLLLACVSSGTVAASDPERKSTATTSFAWMPKCAETIVVPHGVESIQEKAFSGCSSLTSITLPDTVTSIHDKAFAGCSSLTSINIPSSVTALGNDVFSACSALTSIVLSDSVSSIGEKAFYGCSSLTSLTIPDGVKQIGRMAFGGCPSLASVSLPHDVKLRFEDTFPLKTIVTWRPQQLADFDSDASGDVDPGEVDTFVESLTGFASPEAKIEMAKAILAQYDTDSSGTLSAREMGAAKGKSWSAFVAAASQKPPPMHPSTRRLFIDGLGLSDGVHVADVIWASIVAVLVAALLAVATFFCGQAQAQTKPQAGGCCCCSSMTKADLTVAARRSFIFIAVVLIISILAYVSYNYLGGRIDVNAASTLYSFDADRT